MVQQEERKREANDGVKTASPSSSSLLTAHDVTGTWNGTYHIQLLVLHPVFKLRRNIFAGLHLSRTAITFLSPLGELFHSNFAMLTY